MLSICIPVYNFDVRQTVYELNLQGLALNVPFEIILIDDASERSFRTLNEGLGSDVVHYHQLKNNVGRSAIRNLLANKAQYNFLLFLDCDVIIQKEDFLDSYVQEINKGEAKVICGGRLYPSTMKDASRKLRWKYGVLSESKSANIRAKHPHQSFMTNNFVIEKELLKTIRFNEELSGYGHEDTLFGYELRKRKEAISHIENPVMNGDIETNTQFIEKTEEGLLNLARIYKQLNDSNFNSSVKLLATYERLKSKKMDGAFRLQHIMTRSALRNNLIRGKASIKTLNVYKLGCFIQHLNKI